MVPPSPDFIPPSQAVGFCYLLYQVLSCSVLFSAQLISFTLEHDEPHISTSSLDLSPEIQTHTATPWRGCPRPLEPCSEPTTTSPLGLV